MKSQMFKLAGAVLTCAVITACSSDVTNPPPLNSGPASSGDADFTTFVSIGDSLTAGYSDGALYLLGQQNSFPEILEQQFAQVGGGDFVQPLLADPADPVAAAEANLGGLIFGRAVLENRLVLNAETETPERLEGTTTIDATNSGLNGQAFNNMGVPGAKAIHLGLAGYAAGNPYFARFAKTAGSSMIADAAFQMPSFYTLWIGNNDVLGFATSGGDGADAITDPVIFAGAYNQLVADFKTANPAVQGVLVNIASVSSIPFFTTVPYSSIPMDDQEQVDALNDGYAAYNAGVAQALAGNDAEIAKRTISFALGQNAVVLEDEDDLTNLTGVGLPSIRQATASDLILLPTSAKLGTLKDDMDPNSVWGVGPTGALLDSDVLVPSEIEAIDTARAAYNATIKTAADNDPNLIFLDAAALMKQLNESGIDYGNGSINSEFVTGGAFSLDGVHPTARGYAVIANEIINVINTGFNANVHKVDPATFPTIFLK